MIADPSAAYPEPANPGVAPQIAFLDGRLPGLEQKIAARRVVVFQPFA
jgi:hypothetical protein